MGISGYWHVECDDGSGADRTAKIDGSADLKIGEILYKAADGRDWRIDRVDAEAAYAHAVPHE